MAVRGIGRRGVKEWFSGLSFDEQEAVLAEFADVVEASTGKRIGELEAEIERLRSATRRVGAPAAVKATAVKGRRVSPKKGVKVPPKYADGKGNTWAGRGAQPHWVRDYVKKRGKKLEDLLIKK